MQPIGASVSSYGSRNTHEITRRIIVPKRKALRAKEELQRRRRALAASLTMFVLAGVGVCAYADWNDGQVVDSFAGGEAMTTMTTSTRDTGSGWLERSLLSNLDADNLDTNENGRLEWREVDIAIANHLDKVIDDIRTANLSESEKTSTIIAVSTSVYAEAECAFVLLLNASEADPESTWRTIVDSCSSTPSESDGSQTGSNGIFSADEPCVGSEETYTNQGIADGSGNQAGQHDEGLATTSNADERDDVGWLVF